MTEQQIGERHRLIAGLLAVQLDKTFRAARTFDAKELTDGEVMSAIGVMIGGHVAKAERIKMWINAIELSATLAFEEKQRQTSITGQVETQ